MSTFTDTIADVHRGRLEITRQFSFTPQKTHSSLPSPCPARGLPVHLKGKNYRRRRKDGDENKAIPVTFLSIPGYSSPAS
ncbi:hypothetical protein E2C01_089941 [Portunus trituberculatus]|uniref:Uncharacterized protein n=1 Tax=Portunus trituberculatus TaxID=210409 RepID=A0A5B7JNS9_PORTR|nr:hypothetical protein [Portunus trituberculatus]